MAAGSGRPWRSRRQKKKGGKKGRQGESNAMHHTCDDGFLFLWNNRLGGDGAIDSLICFSRLLIIGVRSLEIIPLTATCWSGLRLLPDFESTAIPYSV